jgi:hypothetical protein
VDSIELKSGYQGRKAVSKIVTIEPGMLEELKLNALRRPGR